VHDDLDNAIVAGADHGLEVTNERGDVWTLSGDETLNLSPTTMAIASMAVEAARDNLAKAAATPPSTTLNYSALYRNVLRFVPRPTTAAEHAAAVAKKAAQGSASSTTSPQAASTTGPVLEPGLLDGEAQLKASIATFTDSGNQKTVDAVVKLAGAKLPALFEKLKTMGRVRLKTK
jgi:hypothetical protein